MSQEPRIEERAAQHYIAIPATVTMDGFPAAVDEAFPQLFAFLADPAARPLPADSARIEQALLSIPAIVACHVVSGAEDFRVEAVVPDLASYEKWSGARSTFAIRTVLKRGPVPLDHWR